MVVYGSTCWSQEKFDAAAGEAGHVAVALLRELSPGDRAAALYEASPPIELKLKPKPLLKTSGGAAMKRILTAAVIWLAVVGAALGQDGWSYKNITTDAPTTLKSGPGYLHTVGVNTPAATGTITIYDNTTSSGTKIGTITSFASVSGCFRYDVAYWTGLTVVTATAAPDVTVTFR
jgi:hypothetical protein